MLKKSYRISQKKDFDKIYKAGKKVKGEFGMLIGLEKEDLLNCEFGIVIGKKIGKAHTRNKFKRRLRYLMQSLINEKFFEGKQFQITYIAFKNPEHFEALKDEVFLQCKKLLKK